MSEWLLVGLCLPTGLIQHTGWPLVCSMTGGRVNKLRIDSSLPSSGSTANVRCYGLYRALRVHLCLIGSDLHVGVNALVSEPVRPSNLWYHMYSLAADAII